MGIACYTMCWTLVINGNTCYSYVAIYYNYVPFVNTGIYSSICGIQKKWLFTYSCTSIHMTMNKGQKD